MPNTTSSLEHFDFLQLLHMLADGGKTGVLTIYRPDGNFEAWLDGGRVRHIEMGRLKGVLALAALMHDPVGRFQFDEGRLHPNPDLNDTVNALALAATSSLPEQQLPFQGPARLTAPERLAEMNWSEAEQRILQRLEQQVPLSALWHEPLARGLVSRLLRLGLLKERKSRVARLTVGVTREVRGVAIIDEMILRRWKEDLMRPPQKLAVRDEAGNVYTFAVRGGPNLGAQLLLPPDVLMQTRLQAGESVLVRPV